MSINKAKLYSSYYGGFILVPLFFIIVICKGLFDTFFKALKETSCVMEEAKRGFELRKTFTDNQ